MSKIPKDKIELIKNSGLDQHYKADSWEEYNKKMFDDLAEKYDRGNLIHTFGSKNRLDQKFIQNIPIPSEPKILDVCTGSGDIAILLANNIPNADVTAIDISARMLEQAKKKAKNLSNINFLEGSALQLPFSDGAFDVVTNSFGLRNLENFQQGIKEMVRVTKPGGLVSSIDQGKPKNALIRFFYKLYFFKITPLIGKFFFNKQEYNSFRYLPVSNNYFPSPKELVSMFQREGLENVINYNFFLGAINQQVGQKQETI